MGTVWMADQTAPVKRRVAVKLIRAERGTSKTILARFEAERQAIALMDHPHIARLLDAGTTADGTPFFVMELVKGVPLTDYCDAHRLPVPARLALFTRICAAVQHAHQKGVIHRDLKPTNILVESHDGKPVPKVIDFGLAKATSGLQLTEHTLFTGFGSVMGTPLYMAPEQAAFNAVDVDTRADVYALGGILYELLTGTTPLTRETVRKAALDQVLQLVREQDAPTPSSRLSASEGTPGVAANRQTEAAKLGRFVRGELDWIVLKALSKDRDRRYETATGFARDVERFLNHEPVQAGPPGVGYKVRKFVRRNRGRVIAAGVVAAAVLLGFAGTGVGLVEAQRQEGIARTEADAKEKARADEAAQRRLVEEKQGELARANGELAQVNGTLEKTNGELGTANAHLGQANAGLSAAREKLQVSLARSLLQPFADEEWKLPFRPEDRAADPLSASEAQTVWRVQEADDEGVYRRMLAEALKDPVSTQRLRLHADYILQACVGLNAARRERFERLLAAEVDNPNAIPEGRHAAVVALAGLGGLTPDTALQAATWYHSMTLSAASLSGEKVEPWVLEGIHRPLPPAERGRLLTKFWSGVQKTRPSQGRHAVFADLATRVDDKDAVALIETATAGGVTEVVVRYIDQVMWWRLPALPADRAADILFRIAKRTPVDSLDEDFALMLGRYLALAPTPERQEWAAASVRKLIDEEAKNGADPQIVSDLITPLVPVLADADRAELVEPTVRMVLKLLPVNGSEPIFGLNRLSALYPHCPDALRREVVRQVVEAGRRKLASSNRVTFGLEFTTQAAMESFAHVLNSTLLPFLRQLEPERGLEVRQALVTAALDGIDQLLPVKDLMSPVEGQTRAAALQERVQIAVSAAEASMDGRTDLLLKIEAKVRAGAPDVQGFGEGIRGRLSPDQRYRLLLDQFAASRATPGASVNLAPAALALMPDLGPEERVKLCNAFVPDLEKRWKTFKDASDTSALQLNTTLIRATRYLPPADGYALLERIYAGTRTTTPDTLAVFASSWHTLAAELPAADTAALRDRLWADVQRMAKQFLDQLSAASLCSALASLAPNVPQAEREKVCLAMVEKGLTTAENGTVAKLGFGDERVLYQLPALIPHTPEAGRARLTERLRAEFLRRLYAQSDPLARVSNLTNSSRANASLAYRPAELLEPLARSGGVGARPFYPLRGGMVNPRAVEDAFIAALHPEPESQSSLRLQGVLLAAGTPTRLDAVLPALALASTPRPCPLTDQELVDLLKHPFCVGGARRAVLDVLQKRFRRPFADQWAFVAHVTDHKLPLDLVTPVKRPVD